LALELFGEEEGYVNSGETFCNPGYQTPILKSILLSSLTCCHFLDLDLDHPTGKFLLVLKEVWFLFEDNLESLIE
jgi:hypothetical protein